MALSRRLPVCQSQLGSRENVLDAAELTKRNRPNVSQISRMSKKTTANT